ncbi:MAG: hypothetical protein R6V04_04075 [bacterium]
MQPNGGGSDDTCALGSYFSYDTCLSYNGGDVEYCDCHCLNLGCDDDDDGDVDWGEYEFEYLETSGGTKYGWKLEMDSQAAGWVSMGLGASAVASAWNIVSAVILGIAAVALQGCVQLGRGFGIYNYFYAQNVYWCPSY